MLGAQVSPLTDPLDHQSRIDEVGEDIGGRGTDSHRRRQHLGNCHGLRPALFGAVVFFF
jgi:hypothetical protein